MKEKTNKCRYEDCPLRGAVFMQGKTAVAACAVQGLVTRQVLQSGDCLIRQAAPVRYLYFLRKGYVKYTVLLADGREMILRVGATGHMLGVEMLEKISAQYSIVALTRASICRIHVDFLRKVLAENPKATWGVVKYLSAELQRSSAHIRSLGLLNAHERIVWFILSLVPAGWHPGDGVRVPLPYGDVADLLGLTAETVSRQLYKLRHMGLLKKSGSRLYLYDIERLKKFSGLSWADIVLLSANGD